MKSIVQGLGLNRPTVVQEEEEIRQLTEQFYVTLGASFSRVGINREHPATKRVEELLYHADRTWTHAYEIEQLLVQLYDEETVETELTLRTIEARGVLRKEQAEHYAREAETLEKASEPDTPERRRILLARLVNDLQWRYTVNEAKRRSSKVITSRAGRLFLLALFLFAAGIAVKVLSGVTLTYDDLRLFSFAGLAGAWGATFSMLSTLRNRLEASTLDDLKLMRPWVMLASRILIGAGAASILYFFILSGLLGGAAFPRLTAEPAAAGASSPAPTAPAGEAARATAAESAPTNALPDTQLALLVVWCFIAGFSERLVPGLLARTEARAETSPTDDRFRPSSSRTTTTQEAGPAPVGPPKRETARRTDEGEAETRQRSG